ncbi:MAG: SlyX protein [Woeseiaceae bacterium]|jgi:SlyX protein|nr:SlyX protein [Woeseiaceae bacterium]MDG1016058.1 SlyX family protein [Woeseiaceae bacterium]MDG1712732.1 SlyX family protein [Woeseiaceae bacterium]|tara:strand:- start:2368 stop:2574 length:207 start_codon:yes stop_codon:yes gene_type:complete
MQDDRLIDIETKLSYQESLLDQLNSIIIKQQAELDVLKRSLKNLQERISLLNEASSENNNINELPPHY